MHRSVRPSAPGARSRVTRDRGPKLDSPPWVCAFSQSKQCSNLGIGKPTAWDCAGTLAVVAVSVQWLQTVGIRTRDRLVAA